MKNALKKSKQEDHKVIGSIIEDIGVCMVTTLASESRMPSRPMQVQEVDEQHCLWFFTSSSTEMIKELKFDGHVNVSFSCPTKNVFLSIIGRGREETDRRKMEELWSPALKAWFKQGLETPGITLLRIEMQEAEYWEAPSSPVVKVVGFVKALLSEEPFHPGERSKVQLRH